MAIKINGYISATSRENPSSVFPPGKTYTGLFSNADTILTSLKYISHAETARRMFVTHFICADQSSDLQRLIFYAFVVHTSIIHFF